MGTQYKLFIIITPLLLIVTGCGNVMNSNSIKLPSNSTGSLAKTTAEEADALEYDCSLNSSITPINPATTSIGTQSQYFTACSGRTNPAKVLIQSDDNSVRTLCVIPAVDNLNAPPAPIVKNGSIAYACGAVQNSRVSIDFTGMALDTFNALFVIDPGSVAQVQKMANCLNNMTPCAFPYSYGRYR